MKESLRYLCDSFAENCKTFKYDCGFSVLNNHVAAACAFFFAAHKVDVNTEHVKESAGIILEHIKGLSYYNTDPLRPKRLLLHKNEIRKLGGLVQRQGYTLIPLSVYLKDGRMKMSLGLCVGKHLHDKRDAMAQRDVQRDIHRALREQNR